MSDPLTRASSDSYYRGLAAAYRAVAAHLYVKRHLLERQGALTARWEGALEAFKLAEADCRGWLAELEALHPEALGDPGVTWGEQGDGERLLAVLRDQGS